MVVVVQVTVYGLGDVQLAIALALDKVCNTAGINCAPIICTLTVATITNPTPGLLPPGPQPGPLDPNQFPDLSNLLCSASKTCATAGQCCDNAGICRPGTLDNVREVGSLTLPCLE